MKKLFITIAVALLAAASASAQVKIEVGGNYGGFSNNVNSKNPAASFLRSIKSGFGFSGGVMYDINLLNDVLFLEPGVVYAMNNITIKDINEKMKTQWIQVPLSLGYSANVGFGSIDAFLGLYYGHIIKQDEYLDFNTNDFGINAEVGFALPAGIGLFFNYKRGFIDLSKTSGYRAFSNLASFGLYFKFGGRKE